MSECFNEDIILELVKVARDEGWEVMVKDAYTFVNVNCDCESKQDKFMLTKALIGDVGFELIKK